MIATAAAPVEAIPQTTTAPRVATHPADMVTIPIPLAMTRMAHLDSVPLDALVMTATAPQKTQAPTHMEVEIDLQEPAATQPRMTAMEAKKPLPEVMVIHQTPKMILMEAETRSLAAMARPTPKEIHTEVETQATTVTVAETRRPVAMAHPTLRMIAMEAKKPLPEAMVAHQTPKMILMVAETRRLVGMAHPTPRMIPTEAETPVTMIPTAAETSKETALLASSSRRQATCSIAMAWSRKANQRELMLEMMTILLATLAQILMEAGIRESMEAVGVEITMMIIRRAICTM